MVYGWLRGGIYLGCFRKARFSAHGAEAGAGKRQARLQQQHSGARVVLAIVARFRAQARPMGGQRGSGSATTGARRVRMGGRRVELSADKVRSASTDSVQYDF